MNNNMVAQVEKKVKEYYGLDDGGDLFYNLLEMGVITPEITVEEAVYVVAQHMMQA